MKKQWVRWRAALLLLMLVGGAPLARAQGADNFAILRDQVGQLFGNGKYAEAVPLARRWVDLARQRRGEEHVEFATAITWLARILDAQGGFAEAEPLYKRALAIQEKMHGTDHPSVASILGNLARMYERQGRNAEAEALFKRAMSIYEKALGPNHPSVGNSLNSLAFLYRAMRRYTEAEPLFKRALLILETALGPEHPSVGTGLDNLAVLYRSTGRYAEAEPLFVRGLAIREKALGPHHPSVAGSLANLGALYKSQGRYAEAEPLYIRSLSIREKARGPDHPDVAKSLNNLALLYFAQGNWARAVDFWRDSTRVSIRRAQFGTDEVGQALTGKRRGEAEQVSERFQGFVKAAYRLALDDQGQLARLSSEMFEIAQWAEASDAAASLAQMAARGAKSNVALATLIRERQDLVEEWQKRDGARSEAVSQVSDKRDHAIEAKNVKRLTAIDARIAEIDKRLAAEFSDYAALSRPTPLSVEEVQAQIGADEALVLVLDTPAWRPTREEVFLWVVTRTEMRWMRSDVGTAALTREVGALRCGLDAALWEDEGSAAQCRNLLQTEPQRDAHGNIRSETLPFNTARAHALYKALFGQVEDLIRDKHLLIVPSGPLTQLPFQVLVTAAPSGGDHRATAWLARKHAITVLPAVSSLKALRRVAKASVATKPMLGIGNPLLDGNPAERPWEAQWAQLARNKQACPQTLWQRVAGLIEKRRGVQKIATRGGRADLEHLRTQVPLHDTADELCAVAKDLKLAPEDIVLGAKATETTIKKLNLSQYRVLHFATHGTIAGEVEGTSEPGLILTPPKEQTELDDGYLSASEVAALKLDADWVILSACNTAAGGAQGAEALSGLARAFIYAGARALLVSHWSVDSAAAVKLITTVVGAITRDPKLGRAEALRRAMLALIDKGQLREAHPAFWAPFVVVGEGAAPK